MSKKEFIKIIKELLNKVYGDKLDGQLKMYFNNDEMKYNNSIVEYYPEKNPSNNHCKEMIGYYIKDFMDGYLD